MVGRRGFLRMAAGALGLASALGAPAKLIEPLVKKVELETWRMTFKWVACELPPLKPGGDIAMFTQAVQVTFMREGDDVKAGMITLPEPSDGEWL